jgi:hypothetical protein
LPWETPWPEAPAVVVEAAEEVDAEVEVEVEVDAPR